MRVAHIGLAHVPKDVRIFYKQSRTLAAAGNQVHIVTTDTDPGRHEDICFHSAGPRLVAPRLPALFRRIWLAIARVHRLAATFFIARRIDADVYHLHEPGLIPIGVLLKLRGATLIYDAHEDWREVARRKQREHPGAGRVLFVWYAILEMIAQRRFDHIIVATPTIARRFRDSTAILNYPLKAEIGPLGGAPYGKRAAKVIFAGTISLVRGAGEMMRALEMLPPSLDATLILAGAFASAECERTLRDSPAWARVEYHGWVSREQVRELYAQSRAGLVVFQPAPNHTESLPIKMFEYMAAGIPLIASDFPLWREIIEQAGCGLLVDPAQPAAIAEAMEWLLQNPAEAEAMGRRGLDAVTNLYNWDTEAAKLIGVYRRVRDGAERPHPRVL